MAELDPDDRVRLLDELPATVARALLVDLSPQERDATGLVMGYPTGSVGRRMSPGFVALDGRMTVDQARAAVLERIDDAETVYALPVLDEQERLCGIVGLRRLLATDGSAPVVDILREAVTVAAHAPVEEAARRSADEKLLALPVVDGTGRLVGIPTFDDALDVLEEAESEDMARSGGAEPLRRPYLSTPVRSIVRSRVVWLLGAALGAAGLLGVGPLYGWEVGAVIGLTLLTVCVLAATVGGVMPLAARALKVDPAVFSNPFITTFVDASGLVVYFLIAAAVLGL